jgi:hypothetical protein
MFVDPTSQTCFRTWEYSDIKVAQFLPFHLISPAMPGRRWEDLYRTLAPEICHGSFITAKSMFHPCFQLMFFMLELSLLAKKKEKQKPAEPYGLSVLGLGNTIGCTNSSWRHRFPH